jgi:hypothetical protein
VAWRPEPFKAAIDAMLVEDTTVPRRQRHTARRILARIEERGAEELSYSTVRDYVRVRRAQIDVEAGRRVEVFVPQEHASRNP